MTNMYKMGVDLFRADPVNAAQNVSESNTIGHDC